MIDRFGADFKPRFSGCWAGENNQAAGVAEWQPAALSWYRPPSSRPSPPGEGETVAASWNRQVAGVVGRLNEPACNVPGEILSPGERRKVRAGVKTNFSDPHRPPDIFWGNADA